MSLPIPRANYENIRSSALAPVFTSTRVWDSLTMVGAVARVLTLPRGGKASMHRAPKTCTLSDGEVVSLALACVPLVGNRVDFVGLRWIVLRADVVVVVIVVIVLYLR